MIVPYYNRIYPWLTELVPLLWQAMLTVSSLSASVCHIGGPKSVNLRDCFYVSKLLFFNY